ncbi:MAG: hypothetical protein LQ350_005187 [Teloschistes chrysophthalmus]|nr:MAG: hypothetical protein LQ350_005187 [Niorma chrysophthalma]
MKIAITLAALLSVAACMPTPEPVVEPSNVDPQGLKGPYTNAIRGPWTNGLKGPYAAVKRSGAESKQIKGPYVSTIDQSADKPSDIDSRGLADEAALDTRDNSNVLEKKANTCGSEATCLGHRCVFFECSEAPGRPCVKHYTGKSC